VICRFRDYGSNTVITAQTSPAQTYPAAPANPTGTPEPPASLAAAIDAQARRVDQLSAAIVRATAQVTWSGRAADRFRARAAERARECLQLAVALRASGERVHAAAVQASGGHAAGTTSAGHTVPHNVTASTATAPGHAGAAAGIAAAAGNAAAAGVTAILERPR
jgi:hypothetical protein